MSNMIYDLVDEVQEYGNLSPDYYTKMMHKIPPTKSLDRAQFLLERAKDKVVLDVGCVGPMGEALRKAAKRHYGIDIVPNAFTFDYFQLDVDKVDRLPEIDGLELVIAGEVIEHLSNAGHFLDLLHAYEIPIILTTPNAFSVAGQTYNHRGVEQVNKDHVSWYSWHTLKTLVERHGFEVAEWFWYNGRPYVAEGLIFVLEPQHA